MNDQTFLVLLIVSGVIALAVGVWIGLGYPGLYDRYEDTGSKAPRKAPITMLLERFGSSKRRRDGSRRSGSGRWSRH